MISKLKGIIDTITESKIIIDVGGVGYGVLSTSKTISSLQIDSPASLFIETIVREDSITLYGFASASEQDYFNLLTTVQGVGPKAALSILSSLTPNQISTAVMSSDIASFTSANGIGKKTAERIVQELKDKIAKTNVNIEYNILTDESKTQSLAEDAISVLANLGYTRSQSFDIVVKLINETPLISLDELIKLSLKQINNL